MCGLKAGLPRKGPWGNRLLPPDPVTWQSHMTLRGTATFQGASTRSLLSLESTWGKRLHLLPALLCATPTTLPKGTEVQTLREESEGQKATPPFTEETRGFVPKRQGGSDGKAPPQLGD